MNETVESNDTLIAAVDGSVYPLSNSECVFRAKASGEKHVMTMQVLKALDLCSRFRTFEGHVAALRRGLPDLKDREEDVRRVLKALDKRKLFVSADQILSQADTAKAAELGGVFVRSDGRAGALSQLLQSCLANEQRSSNRYRYFVVDDAGETQDADRCSEVVSGFCAEGIDCRWLGRDWQRAFTERLIEASKAKRSLVEWAMLNEDETQQFTGGRLRNLIALICAGRPYLLLDDDLVCEARAHNGANSLRVDVEEWELWFHEDAATAKRWGEPVDFDPLARHAAMLGLPVGGALDALDTAGEALAGLDQRMLSRVLDSPVLTTVSGTYGDAASDSKLWFYTIDGASRERFWASREAYDRNRASRFVSRARGGLTLTPTSQFTPVGLAGQWILPPTMPTGRNEDSLYAATQHCLYPQSRSLEFPWALGHFPDQARHWRAEPWEQPCNENLARFIGACLMSLDAATPGGEAGPRYALLADQLQLISSGKDAQLEARLDEFMLFVRSDVVAQLQQRLNDSRDTPVYWGADVRRIIEVNGKALVQGEPARLHDMPEGLDREGRARWLREGMDRYAKLLRLWPRLWHAARELDALPE